MGLWSAISEFLFFAEESLVGQGFDPNVGNMSDLQWNKVISINIKDSKIFLNSKAGASIKTIAKNIFYWYS